MRIFKILALSIAAALVSGLPQVAQAVPMYDQHDTDKAYKDGYKHGRDDAEDHRSAYPKSNKWKHGDERKAYEQGYQAGYSSLTGSAAETTLPQAGVVAGADSARDIGYQDGMMDGRNDRNTGHSFRPTDTDNYKHADRGYNDSLGNKNAWKTQYRQGYADGYRQGYKRH